MNASRLPFVNDFTCCILAITATTGSKVDIRLGRCLDLWIIHRTKPSRGTCIGTVVSRSTEIFKNRANSPSIVIARPHNRFPELRAVTIGNSLCTEIQCEQRIFFIHAVWTQLQTDAWCLRILTEECAANVGRFLQLCDYRRRKADAVIIHRTISPAATGFNKWIHVFLDELIHSAMRFKKGAEVE